MRLFLILLTLCFTVSAFSQTVITYDHVKTKEGEFDNYISFVEKNWMVIRQKAKEKGIVVDYRYEILRTDSSDVILITQYKNDSAFQNRDKIFLDIYKQYFPNGPVLVNGKRMSHLAEVTRSHEVRQKSN